MSLEQDYTVVPGQLFACLSIVGPESPQKNDKFGIKIRGAFATRDEAANHAKRLQKEDPIFDIYVVDLYKWLLIPPDPTKIEDVHYTNEKLEEIMVGYRENQSQAARMFQERKQGMMDAKSHYSASDDNSKFYTKSDEAPISHPAEILERLKNEKPGASIEDLVKEADAIVKAEIEERRVNRDDAESSTNGRLESVEDDEEEEVTSALAE
jgi:hypothetical protein